MSLQIKYVWQPAHDQGLAGLLQKDLLLKGGNVVIIDRDEKAGQETVNIITKANGIAIFSKCDVGNADEIKASVDLALFTYNKIDVLVNNAAIMTFKKIIDLTVEEWDMVMQVNMRSVFLFCKFCIPHLNNGAVVT